MIDEDVRSGVEKEFTEEEIKEALIDCKGDKSLGLDGFSMRFVHEF